MTKQVGEFGIIQIGFGNYKYSFCIIIIIKEAELLSF